MNLLNQLSSAQGRRDQQPNIELGSAIAKSQNKDAILEIQRLLESAHITIDELADLLKVLEAIGEHSPELIINIYPEIKKYLNHPVNHIVWRGMCVLSQIAPFNREQVFKDLGRILQIMDKGSVITKDHGFKILVDLYKQEAYTSLLKPLMSEQLMKAPDNQFGQYAEKWMAVIATKDVHELLRIVQERLPELTSSSHQKRAEKIILKLLKKVNQ